MAPVTLVAADPHWSPNPRDAYRWIFLEETLPTMIEKHGIGRVIIAGDLTEAKDGHTAALVNRLVDGVSKLAEAAPVYVLKGNHDYVAEDVPFYRFLRHLPRVRWINEPTQLNLRGLGKCLFLPHTRRLEDWDESITDNFDWFFCHQTFKGAALSQGHRAEGSAAPFSVGARVVSGDVHVPQEIGPVTYVGAPYHVDFGDDYSPRVLLLEGTKMRSVPVPGPQKRLLTSTGDVLAMKGKCYPGDIVKVRVALPASAKTSRAEVRHRCRAWAEEAGVSLHAVEIIAPKVVAAGVSRNRSRASDADLVRAYGKKMSADKIAVAAGLKLMDET